MKKSKCAVIVCTAVLTQLAHGALVTNSSYILDVPIGPGLSDYGITVTLPTTVDPGQIVPPQVLRPEFLVQFTPTNPVFRVGWDMTSMAPGTSIYWSNNFFRVPKAILDSILDTPEWLDQTKKSYVVSDDSIPTRTWTATPWPGGGTPVSYSAIGVQGTSFAYYVGDGYVMTPTNATLNANGQMVAWAFPSTSLFNVTATLNLPSGGGEPRISYHLIPKSTGYYSMVFTGAPKFLKTDLQPVAQDVLGLTDRIYNHEVPESFLKMPRAQVTSSDNTWGAALLMEPTNISFTNPDGTLWSVDYKNSRFGMMMSNVDFDYFPVNTVQPVSMTPIMGGPGSYLTPSSPDIFNGIRYLQKPGDFATLQQYIATIYGVNDIRDNTGTGSMNRTLERIVAYLGNYNGNNYALWDAEQKYYDYSDMPGTFKPFSSLYGLMCAIVLDDETFYLTRALPAVEYSLSRKTASFIPYDIEDTAHLPSGTKNLGAPYLNSIQLAALHNLYQRRSGVFYNLAINGTFSAADFAQLLAKYSITDNVADFNAAVAKAKVKLNTSGGWRNWAFPQDWLDLYQACTPPLPAGASPDATTYYPQFAPAARYSIYEWVSQGLMLSPSAPSGTVAHDPGGVAPLHLTAVGVMLRLGYPKAVGFPIPAAKQGSLPGWRLSLAGLDNQGYPQIWMDDQGRMMRIAALESDTFLKGVARMGMVGRFANYPGDNRVAPSVVMEDPNLPENPRWTQTHATINPGHAWELAGEVIDFLVGDFYYSSNKSISFPWRSMKGSGNPFQISLYGDQAGTFYADSGVRLWLPANLFTIDNPQIDYLSGYGTGANANTLYVAFVNRSATTQVFTADVLTSRVTFPTGSARRWLNNGSQSTYGVGTNKIASYSLTGKGIVAFAIPNATFVSRPLHDKMFSSAAPILTATNAYKTATTGAPYPKNTVYGMLISLGKGLTTGYVYSDALAADTISATLTYQQGSTTQTLTDKIFPYEFSPPYDDTAVDPIQCTLSLKDKNSNTYSATVTLQP